MARKSRSSDRPQQGPSLAPEHAAQLLRLRSDKGRRLLHDRPFTSATEQAWETVTRDILIRAFGSESPNISSVMDVGKYDFAFGGGNEKEWERARAKNMETRIEIIDSLIELLESNVALEKTGSVTGNTTKPDVADRTGSEMTLQVTKKLDLDVFVSHSAKDADLAEALVELMRAALNIPSDRIRCMACPIKIVPLGLTDFDVTAISRLDERWNAFIVGSSTAGGNCRTGRYACC